MRSKAAIDQPVSVAVLHRDGSATSAPIAARTRYPQHNRRYKSQHNHPGDHDSGLKNLMKWHSTQPADFDLFRCAMQGTVAIAHAVFFRQPQAERIS